MAKSRPPPRSPASRPWTDVEIDELERAWDAADAAALERTGAAVGVPFTLDELAKLERRVKLPRRMVLLALAEAMSSEAGIAVRDEQAFMSASVCLAAVANGKLYAAIGHTGNKGDGPAQMWGWLKPWYREMAKNRPKVESWLAKELPNRFELPITVTAPAPTTDKIQALREAIVVSPDDDAPRQVLADLLIERGDAHGELITLQLGKTDYNGPIAARITQLVEDLGERIAGEVHAQATRYELRRGFVDTVTMNADKFASKGERLFTEHPIRELVLRPLRTNALAKLAASPALARVRALTLRHDGGATETPLVPILSSPHLERLEKLTLKFVEAPDWDFAFAALAAPQLRRIDIDDGNFPPRALIALLANHSLPALATLFLNCDPDYGWQHPSHVEATAIATAIGNSRLKTLILEREADRFAVDDWRCMVSGSGSLEALDVDLAEFNGDCLDAVTAGRACGLRSLELSLLSVETTALERFLRSPAGARLERLILTSGFRNKPGEVLARLPADHPLRYVAGVPDLDARFIDARVTDHPDARGWVR